MTECKHLVSCGECEFVIRMQQKCPLCRKVSKFSNLKEEGKRKGVRKSRSKSVRRKE